MNCKRCGTELRKDEQFCYNCGKKNETVIDDIKGEKKLKYPLVCGIIGVSLPMFFPFVWSYVLISILVDGAPGFELNPMFAVFVLYVLSSLVLGIFALVGAKKPNVTGKKAAIILGSIAIGLGTLIILLFGPVIIFNY